MRSPCAGAALDPPLWIIPNKAPPPKRICSFVSSNEGSLWQACPEGKGGGGGGGERERERERERGRERESFIRNSTRGRKISGRTFSIIFLIENREGWFVRK
jgi:hypothetical protein